MEDWAGSAEAARANAALQCRMAQGLSAVPKLQYSKKALRCIVASSHRALQLWDFFLPCQVRCKIVKGAEMGERNQLGIVEGEVDPYPLKNQGWEGGTEARMFGLGWLLGLMTSGICLMTEVGTAKIAVTKNKVT